VTGRAIALAAAVAAGCTFHTRSDEFECDTSNDCVGDRECVLGWCVSSNAAECPDVCTACDDTTCLIECEQPGSCDGEVECPFGFECVVRCEGAGSCSGGIDCRDADACEIRCIGPGSCSDQLECGAGVCEISCSGINSCDEGIETVHPTSPIYASDAKG
jgi:hypothetical protein